VVLTLVNITSSEVPILFPIRLSIPAATTRVISFPDEFLGIAVSINVQNEDGANPATFRYGGEALPSMNIPASSFRTVTDTRVKLLQIITGAAGVCIVEAQLIPITREVVKTEIEA
jgi:hypothetical protein